MPSYYGIVELPAGSSIRLDRYVAETLKLLTRSQIKARCLGARVNGTQVKISRILMGGENLELSWEEAPPSLLVPEDIPLKVLYEDERVIVVNKRQGMVVHPAAGNRSGTLMNALLARRIRSSGVGGQISDFRFQISDFRGGCQASVAGGELPRGGCQAVGVGERAFIVHRLDKDTSGVIICAYDDDTLRFLAAQFRERSVKKKYYAITRGLPPQPSGIIDANIGRDKHDRKKFCVCARGGKTAVTRYRLVRVIKPPISCGRAGGGGKGGSMAGGGKGRGTDGGSEYALLALYPKTGRTHQIRVHLRHIGCPILGDPVYSAPDPLFPAAPLLLHARTLRIRLPDAGPRLFRAPLPAHFKEFMALLFVM